MKRSKLKVLLTLSTLAIVLTFTSCKGRTMDNVEPTGDTVEVTGLMSQPAVADSI